MLESAHSPAKPQESTPLILVCYHKFSTPIIASEILRPIIVGAANMGEGAKALQEKLESKLPKNLRLEGQQILLDSSGDNISRLNPHFCELTAMYWAWKNVDSSYYGLFHYRRILDLSEQALKAPPSLEPTQVNAKKKWRASAFGYAKERVDELLAHYDIILPQRYIDRTDNLDFSDMTLYDIYAKYHYAKDLDRIIELIKSRHPEMQAALESTLFTYPPRWHIANIFIMRKELYFAYCEWLFSLLFDLSKETDLSDYTPYQARIYGFLSERMFNIWLAYQRHTQTLKILEAPMLLLTKHTKPLIGWDINEKHKRFYLFGVRVYKKSLNPKS